MHNQKDEGFILKTTLFGLFVDIGLLALKVPRLMGVNGRSFNCNCEVALVTELLNS